MALGRGVFFLHLSSPTISKGNHVFAKTTLQPHRIGSYVSTSPSAAPCAPPDATMETRAGAMETDANATSLDSAAAATTLDPAGAAASFRISAAMVDDAGTAALKTAPGASALESHVTAMESDAATADIQVKLTTSPFRLVPAAEVPR